MTKRELLAGIRRGFVSVELKYGTTWYRIALPASTDPSSGVWISLSADRGYAIDDSSEAHANIDGKNVPLTRREADSIAALVAETMKLREEPWRR